MIEQADEAPDFELPDQDGRAVKLLVDRSTRPQPAALEIDARLAGIGQPPPDGLADYDQLRTQEQGL